MGFSSFFTGPSTVTPPAAPAAPSSGGPIQVQSKEGAPANPNAAPHTMLKVDPNNPDNTPKDPLGAFEQLFKRPVDKDGKEIVEDNDDPNAPMVPVDVAQLNKLVTGMDFAKGLDQTEIAKALAGDAAAFGAVINKAIQQAVATTLQVSTSVSNIAAREGMTRTNKGLDSRLNKRELEAYTPQNPAFQSPVARMQLARTAEMIAKNNPKMPAKEVGAQAEQMFIAMAGLFQNQNADGTPATPKKPAQTDWSTYFGVEQST